MRAEGRGGLRVYLCAVHRLLAGHWHAPHLLGLPLHPAPAPARVLIFLEALALGRQPPAFGLHLCPQLLAAARHLGLRDLEVGVGVGCCRRALGVACTAQGQRASLPPSAQACPWSFLHHSLPAPHPPPTCPQEYAQERLGESTARLRLYSFEEIRELNAAGGCWLILDGMVLDVVSAVLAGTRTGSTSQCGCRRPAELIGVYVPPGPAQTRWLPEHPGGSTIIPKQSLNLDCARQFEL